ncbi:NHL repeat-containing protein [Acrasis kona]|uniref:NHL repeat-containing protein n=1 Tax=Acrasis kona TaxID=1008807 RepID=A0AAW2ZER2_9EUKA
MKSSYCVSVTIVFSVLLFVLTRAQPIGMINAFAGGEEGYLGENILSNNSVMFPRCLGYDREKALMYICSLHRIYQLNITSNLITTFAGTALYGYNGDNILANTAQLYNPYGVAIDFINNLVYIADSSNNRIRVVDRATNIIKTFAGTGVNTYNGDNIAAINATIAGPESITIDSVNNLVYIADTQGYRIRIVDRATGNITTFAGKGVNGNSGDNGLATNAQFRRPTSVAVDVARNLVYIADSSTNRVKVVNRTSNIIKTFAGTGTAGYAGDNATATSAMFYAPVRLSFDSTKNLLYITDQGNARIRVVNCTSNIVTPFAGTSSVGAGNIGLPQDNILATSAPLTSLIYDTLVDTVEDRVFIIDKDASLVRVVKNGYISTFAGSGYKNYAGDGLDVSYCRFNYPMDVVSDNNLVYISDVYNNRIRVIDRNTNITTTFAGTGIPGYNGDNILATNAQLNTPIGLAIDYINNLVYISDAGNNRVRVVDRNTGIITTFAGTGQTVYNGENIRATDANMDRPRRIVIDNPNNLVYFTDLGNVRIRVVNRTTNNITTIAGRGITAYNGDNILAYNAYLGNADGIALDGVNNLLYVGDNTNQRFRVINFTTGNITTIAGTGSSGYNGDNVVASTAPVGYPSATKFDPYNNLNLQSLYQKHNIICGNRSW